MNKIAEFAIENIGTIGMIYAIAAGVVFVAVMIFFTWVFLEDRKEQKENPREYAYKYGEGETGSDIILIGTIMAMGCAILWWGIPILILFLWIYSKIDERFPTLTRGKDSEETEE